MRYNEFREKLELFENKIKTYIDNDDIDFVIKEAITNNNIELLTTLVTDITIDYTHIAYSIYKKNIELLMFLIEHLPKETINPYSYNRKPHYGIEYEFVSFQCIYYDFIEGFKYIVNNYIEKISDKCLYLAIEHIRIDFIEYILSHPKNSRDYCDIHSFDIAIKTGNDILVRQLVSYGLQYPDYRYIEKLDISGLEYAIANYDYKFPRNILEDLVKFNRKPHTIEIIHFLDYLKETDIEKKIDWVSYSKDLFSTAIKFNNAEILRKFKDSYGAMVNEYDLTRDLDIERLELIRSVYTDFTYPPHILNNIIRFQSDNGKEKVYRYLDYIRKTDAAKTIVWSSTWITLAINYRNFDIIKYLVDMGIKFNSYDNEEFHRCKSIYIILYLLEHYKPQENPLLNSNNIWPFYYFSPGKLVKHIDFTKPGLLPLLYMDLKDMDKTLRQKAREQRGLIELSKKK